jgi:hypothetical protein
LSPPRNPPLSTPVCVSRRGVTQTELTDEKRIMKPYYEQDGITIYHGDASMAHSAKFTALITDPPYGVGVEYGEGFSDDEHSIRYAVVPVVSWCAMTAKRAAVTPGTRCAWLYPRPDEIGCLYFPAGAGFSRWGFTCFQPILYYGKDPYPPTNKQPNSRSWTGAAEDLGHPCPKPLGLMTWLVNRATATDDVVIDPFMGTGTTLVACKLAGRNAIGIEREERYCEIAANRLSQGVLFGGAA